MIFKTNSACPDRWVRSGIKPASADLRPLSAVERQRVQRRALIMYLVVQVRTGGNAGGTYVSQYLVLINVFAYLNDDAAAVRVVSFVSAAVVDYYKKSVGSAEAPRFPANVTVPPSAACMGVP